MILDIIAYLIIAVVVVWAIWRIFCRKKKVDCSAGCDGCPYCSTCSKNESQR